MWSVWEIGTITSTTSRSNDMCRWKPFGWDALRPCILAVEILRYSFDLDGFVDGCEITVGVASS